MKCTELVIEDHVILRRGLSILDGMVKKLEDGERIEIADVKTILKFFRLFGDEYHQTMEEKVLFPALMRAAPEESPLGQMLLEHGQERALVDGIEDALGAKRTTELVRTARRLSQLLRNHFDREDAVLRELPERSLSNEEDNGVVAEFMKSNKQPETYENFSRLEFKYTPKPHRQPLSPARELPPPRASAPHR